MKPDNLVQSDEERLQLINYLKAEDYDDPFWHSKFWDIDESEDLLEKQSFSDIPSEMKNNLQELENGSTDTPQAVKKYLQSGGGASSATNQEQGGGTALALASISLGFIIALMPSFAFERFLPYTTLILTLLFSPVFYFEDELQDKFS